MSSRRPGGDKAIKDYDEAIRLDPKDAEAFVYRGITWKEKGELDKAFKDFDEAIRLDPKDAWAFVNRGMARHKKKEYDKALKDYDKAIGLDPKDAEAFVNRAWLCATCPEEKYRNGKKAVESARRACELTGWKDASYIDALAAAHAEAGNFDEAVKWQKKALEFSGLDDEVATEYRKRLKLYEGRKPYRQE